MRALLQILNLSTQHLQQCGIENPRRQAEELIADALGLSRMQLYLEHERPLQESELTLIRERLSRRAKGEPNPYIRGEVQFHGSKIRVTPDVLIPRQETEILVERVMQDLAGQELSGKVLVDLCTGSGCIGIALKKRFPELHVCLSDISPKALAIARENGAGLDVEFVQGDLLEPFQGRKIDYLVCNPPYVSETEYDQLDREVKWEPREALVAGPSGLEFYERLAGTNIPCWFEIGHTQGKALLKLFPEGQILKDWAGKDRFFINHRDHREHRVYSPSRCSR